MVEESSTPHPALTSGTRCVVLTGTNGSAPGSALGSAPGDLLAGLSKRGVSTVVVAEPAGAMLELARQTTGALIVVEPDRQPWLDHLVQAVMRYHPRTVRWGYHLAHASGGAQLQPLSQTRPNPTTAPVPAPVPEHDDDEDAGPTHYSLPNPYSPLGRVQAQMPRERVRSLVVKVQGPAEVGEPLISEEELAMLLGPVPPVPEEQGGA